MNPQEEAKELGFNVVFVPHKTIKDYNACYHVIYKGKKIRPRPALKLKIPLNEIWISEKFREYKKFILFHELQEIKYRRKGLKKSVAHKKALEDEISLWKDNPEWKRMNEKVGVGRKHLTKK